MIGALAVDRDVWTDGISDTGRPFEFVADSQSLLTLPRPGDRIRLREGGQIVILDFGSRGEALRNRSPVTRPVYERHVTEQTGARVDAGGVYTVADVQLEPVTGMRYVWVRLAALQ